MFESVEGKLLEVLEENKSSKLSLKTTIPFPIKLKIIMNPLKVTTEQSRKIFKVCLSLLRAAKSIGGIDFATQAHKKEIVFTLISVLLFFNLTWAQMPGPMKDEVLEKLLRENSVTEAKTYLSQKQDSLAHFLPEQQAYYLNRISQLKLMLGEFGEALDMAKQAKTAIQDKPNSALWGETYRSMCFAYIRNGKLDSALIYAEKLYEFTKSNQDLGMRRGALMALGNISLQNKFYQRSLDFYAEALEITEKQKDSINLKVDYYNVGLALSQLDEYQKSEEYLLKAALRAEKEKALDLLARIYGTLADNYLDQSKFEEQIKYLKKANEIAEKIGNTQLLAMGYANLSETALILKNYTQAIGWGNQSLAKLKERPLLQLQAKVDSMLYVSHKEIGNFEIALKKLESYDQVRLQIRNQAQKEKLEQLTLQFETEKKDLLIQNQEISLQEEKAKNRVFIVSIVLLGTLTFFLIYIMVKNSKTRNLLFKKERELDQAALFAALPERTPESQDLNLISTEGENNEQKLFNELVLAIKEKKLYLDPKINQQTIVSEFGTNRQYVYEAISKSGEDNFRGMINRFRINEAKELMEKGQKNGETLDFNLISEKVGFNSYPTFYRSFKNLTGLTPNEYIKELKHYLEISIPKDKVA